MILIGRTIKELDIITPFKERTVLRGKSYGLGSIGYDTRIDLPTEEEPGRQRVVLKPGGFVLTGTKEKFNLPNDVMGMVFVKSSWARQGILHPPTTLEPGWRGYLTLEIHNNGPESIELLDYDPVIQVVFHRLEGEVDPYRGKYDQQEKGAQEARDE